MTTATSEACQLNGGGEYACWTTEYGEVYLILNDGPDTETGENYMTPDEARSLAAKLLLMADRAELESASADSAKMNSIGGEA